MPPRPVVALLVAVALLAVVAPAAAVGSSSHSAVGGPSHLAVGADSVSTTERVRGSGLLTSPQSQAQQNETYEPTDVQLRVTLQPDGDARWRISATFPIHDANDSAGFESLAASFEDDETPLGYEAFQAARSEAATVTGRTMELRNVTKSHSRANETGTLVLSFTWSNFARTEGDRLYVGDAFNTTEGTWLGSLPENRALVIKPPDGYEVTSAPEVGIVDRAARWEGPYDFDGREPWIVYSGETSPSPGSGGETDTSTTMSSPGGTETQQTGTGEPPDGGLLSSLLPVAILVLVAGASAAVLAVLMRREDGSIGVVDGATGDDSENSDQSTAETTDVTPTAGTDDASSVDDATLADNAAATGATEAEPETDDADDIDETLLSDEERVERLLEQNGGRMKQANIVKETGWSNAKVSQLLSAMADDDRVDKLRIGRENLISFPDEDIGDFDSDDE